jgi:DNA-directed RNA polymerase beta' subunit
VLEDSDLFGNGEEEGEDEEMDGGSSAISVTSGKPRFMPGNEVAAQMQLLWEGESEVLRRAFLPVRSDGGLAKTSIARQRSKKAAGEGASHGYGGRLGWRHFFLRVIPVAASRFRPPTKLGESTYEHPQNLCLSKIMKLNDTLVDLGLGGGPGAETRKSKDGSVDLRRAIVAYMELQNSVNGLLDSSKAARSNGVEPTPGIKQLLEKKAGLFRQNMMGKRVNYAARTVISPDPFLRTDQVGVPLRFAKKLHFKQPVTSWNVEEMRVAVINGPDLWPGATHVEDEYGVVTDLAFLDRAGRTARANALLIPTPIPHSDFKLSGAVNPLGVAALPTGTGGLSGLGGQGVLTLADLDPSTAAAAAAAGGLKGTGIKRVYRHLRDGDIVLMNRQVSSRRCPRLHVPRAPPTSSVCVPIVHEEGVFATCNINSQGPPLACPHAHLPCAPRTTVGPQIHTLCAPSPPAQPTLHKPSIMAVQARVMKAWPLQQILRFHYANCKTFNADFDGDEMNLHFPQDELSRAEAYHICASHYQYLSGTGGAPLRGLIQDHNSVAVLLSRRDNLLTRDQYCQLVLAGLQALPRYGVGSGGSSGDGLDAAPGSSGRITVADIPMLPPAVLKPQPLWTGKQVISTLLKGLTAHLPEKARGLYYDGKSKIGEGLWGAAKGRKDVIPVGESTITIRGSELLTGVIDKSALGNTSYGLVHAMFEVHGPQAASALLSSVGRLLTVFLQWSSMTCGIMDLSLDAAADAARTKIIAEGRAVGARAAAKFVGLPPGVSADASTPGWTRNVRRRLRDRLRGGAAGADVSGAAAIVAATALDNAVKGAMAGVTGSVIDAALPYGLAKQFPANQFSLMVASGAKGSQINHAMIAVGLGQQELEGRRVPAMASGKTLPCFPPFDPAPRAGGYIADRFLTGLRPAEYFFHCMSGREGLVDTAVKTSRSGYLQRCLVKHLESLRVHYDGSVRDADGGLVQVTYGEDGMDVLSTPYLGGTDAQLSFLARNASALTHTYGMSHPAFAHFVRSQATGGSGDAVKRCEDAILAGRSLAAPTAPAAAADALALAVRLGVGSAVMLRMPASLSLSLVQQAAASASSELSVDGRTTFTPAVLGSDAGLTFVAGVIVKVRESGAYDVRVSLGVPVALPVYMPRVVSKKGAKSKSKGKGKGKGKKGKKGGEEDSEEEAQEEVEAPLSDDDMGGSALDRAPGGTAISSITILVKRVPLLAPSPSPSAPRPVLLRPSSLPLPLMAHMHTSTLGVYGEALKDRVEAFLASNPGGVIGKIGGFSAVAFRLLMSVKAMKSLVAPGEPVGVIAAQSIGEPSTQMTLNTFHLAGGGGVNVTLGIPRLREIVMTASAKPKTPSMILPLGAHLEADSMRAREIAGRLARALSPLPMAELLDALRADGGIVVVETLRPLHSGSGAKDEDADEEGGGSVGKGAMWVREYAVRLHLADAVAISGAFGLSFMDVANKVGAVFAPRLLKIIADDGRKADRAVSAGIAAKASPAAEEQAEEGEEGEGEEGAAPASRKTGGGRKKALEGDGDEDDEGEEDENEVGEADGNVTVGTKRGARDYEEEEGEEEEEEEASSSDSGSSTSSSSSSESESAESESEASDGGFVRRTKAQQAAFNKAKAAAKAGKGASASAKAPKIAKKGGKGKVTFAVEKETFEADQLEEEVAPVKKARRKAASTLAPGSTGRLTAKRLAADRADRSVTATLTEEEVNAAYKGTGGHVIAPPAGTISVNVPDALTRNPRFGGILACPSGLAPGLGIVETSPWIEVTILFPASARKVLMLSSAERAAASALMLSVPGITRAIVSTAPVGRDRKQRTCVMTEGQAIPAAWRLAALQATAGSTTPDVLDTARLVTNDIAAVLRTYGVEAARACVVREMRGIFDAYGIGVDARHLYLVADYMTQHGGYRAMNRAGIDGHGSPFLKMSFETTAAFLTSALLRGEHERMTSPSSRIALGRPVDAGTGSFCLFSTLRGI